MKIAHLLDEPWHSGLTAYALTLAEGQRRLGHEASIWAPSESPAFAEAGRSGLPVFPLDRPYLRLRGLRSEVRRSGVEVLNAHTGRTHTLAIFLAAGSACSVVRTRGDARVPSRRPGLAWTLARTDGLIAANAGILSGLESVASLPGARASIHQGIALDGEFQPAPLPAGPIAGLLGRLDPVKGHRIMLEAAALASSAAPALRWRAAGADANLRRTNLEADAKRLGGAGVAAFEGAVARPAAFMRSCSFGLIPSLGSEAVSRAALEWMACGRAVIASRVGALPELVEHGVTGLLIPPSDPRALADAASRLALEPALAAKMGEAARRRIEERFGLERFAAATVELYERARAGRAVRA
jgi:glycosyltransferase involved in cell wall biosynthesis